MPKIFKFYCDPGHGWIAAKRSFIDSLKIGDKISNYSYQKGGTVYLEEDCDATLFLNAMDARGIEFKLVSVYQENTPIRNYNYYKYEG